KRPARVELSAEVTVAAFWAPWCKPCLRERPMVEALRKTLAADARVRVLTVNVDEDDGATLYEQLFGSHDLMVPRMVVVNRALGGRERMGARTHEASDDCVRDVSAAVRAVEGGGTPAPPSDMWKLFRAPARR